PRPRRTWPSTCSSAWSAAPSARSWPGRRAARTPPPPWPERAASGRAARHGTVLPVAELLVVRNLVRRFGDRTVLDRLSFELDAGEVCAVVGPNGAGKTTLLRCVVGADRADGGS